MRHAQTTRAAVRPRQVLAEQNVKKTCFVFTDNKINYMQRFGNSFPFYRDVGIAQDKKKNMVATISNKMYKGFALDYMRRTYSRMRWPRATSTKMPLIRCGSFGHQQVRTNNEDIRRRLLVPSKCRKY